MASSTRKSWHGDEIKKRAKRAIARGTIAIGENVSGEAKKQVHVESSDLRRSIHVAAVETMGEIPAGIRTVTTRSGATLEVGSWLDYACVEEVGRQHRFMAPALDHADLTADITMKAAWAEEGLALHG